MENINTTSSVTEIVTKKVIQPYLIIQALAFTGILYFSVGQTPSYTSEVTYQSIHNATLATSIGNSVLQHASHESGAPTSTLRIIHAQPQTWSDNCLGLGASESLCIQMRVPGWQVAVASGQQRWIYRTNATGSLIKLDRGISSPSAENGKVALSR